MIDNLLRGWREQGVCGLVAVVVCCILPSSIRSKAVSGLIGLAPFGFNVEKAGWSAFKLSNLPVADQWFEAARQYHPDLPGGFLGRAVTAHSTGDWHLARDYARRALTISPELTEAAEILGLAAAELGDKAILEDVNNAEAWLRAAELQGSFTQAEIRLYYLTKAAMLPTSAERAGQMLLSDLDNTYSPEVARESLRAVEQMPLKSAARCLFNAAMWRELSFAECAVVRRLIQAACHHPGERALLKVALATTESDTAALKQIDLWLADAREVLSSVTHPDPIETIALAGIHMLEGEIVTAAQLLRPFNDQKQFPAITPLLVSSPVAEAPGPVISQLTWSAVRLSERHADRHPRTTLLTSLAGTTEDIYAVRELAWEADELLGRGVIDNVLDASLATYDQVFIDRMAAYFAYNTMPISIAKWIHSNSIGHRQHFECGNHFFLVARAAAALGNRDEENSFLRLAESAFNAESDSMIPVSPIKLEVALRLGSTAQAQTAGKALVQQCLDDPHAGNVMMLSGLLTSPDKIVQAAATDGAEELLSLARTPGFAELNAMIICAVKLNKLEAAAELARGRGMWAYRSNRHTVDWYRAYVQCTWGSTLRRASTSHPETALWQSETAPVLQPLNSPGTCALEPEDIPLFAKLRDEKHRLPEFLSHYRRLGVTRFFLIDNGSTDGSLQLLLNQADCAVFQTSGSLLLNDDCVPWINGLIDHHAPQHWCVSVDIDEHLDFEGSAEGETLRSLRERLDSEGADSLCAFLVDMFPQSTKNLREHAASESLLNAHCWFDNTYQRSGLMTFPYATVNGGFRERMHPTLHSIFTYKTPFFNAATGWRHVSANHNLDGGKPSVESGVLRHYKFATNEVKRSNFGEHLRTYNQSVSTAVSKHENLTGPDSVKFETPAQFDTLGYYRLTGRRPKRRATAKQRELIDTGMIAACGQLANFSVTEILKAELPLFDQELERYKKNGQRRVPYLNTPGVKAATFDKNLMTYVSEALGEPWVMWGANLRRGIPNRADLWHVDLESTIWRCLTVVIGVSGCHENNSTRFISHSHCFEKAVPEGHNSDEYPTVLDAAAAQDRRCQVKSFTGFGNGSFYGFDARGWHAGPKGIGEERLMLYMHFHPSRCPRIPLMRDYKKMIYFDKPAPYLSMDDQELLLNNRKNRDRVSTEVNHSLARLPAGSSD